MQMAPYVYNFIRSQGYAEPNIVQRTAGTLGKLALLGAAGAGLYGLTKLELGTVTSTADPTPTPEPPQDQAGQPQPEKTRNEIIGVIGEDDLPKDFLNDGNVQSEPPVETQTNSDLAVRDASGLTEAQTGSSELEGQEGQTKIILLGSIVFLSMVV